MGFWETKEKGRGAYKQAKKAAKGYITEPGTRMGVGGEAFDIGDTWTSIYDKEGRRAQQREAPGMQAAQVGPGARIAGGGWGAGQEQLGNLMWQRAMGQGPSIAEMQMGRGMDRAVAAQLAMAAGAPASQRAAAQRTAASNIGGIQQDIVGQGAMLRAQEQLAAQEGYGRLATGARGQDIQLGTAQAGLEQQAMLQQAGFQQQAGQANLQAQIQMQGMNDALTQYYMQMGFNRDVAMQQAAAQMETLMAQNYATAMGSHRQITPGPGAQILGGAMQAGGAMGAAAISRGGKK